MNEWEPLDPRLLGEPEGEEPAGDKIAVHERGISFWFAWVIWFVVLYILAVTIGPSFIHLGLGIPMAYIVSALVAMIGGLLLALATVKLQRWKRE